MANTSVIYARIDTYKNNAESILSRLGISHSSAIQMMYAQIVLKNGMPFDLKLPDNRITAIDGMNNEQIGAELQKGLDSLKGGSFTPDDIDEMLKNKYDI